MDPSKPEKYLADREMYKMWVASQRENKASRRDTLCLPVPLSAKLQSGPCYNVCEVQVAFILPGADCRYVCSIFSIKLAEGPAARQSVALVRPTILCMQGKQATAYVAKSQLVYFRLGFSTVSCLA